MQRFANLAARPLSSSIEIFDRYDRLVLKGLPRSGLIPTCAKGFTALYSSLRPTTITRDDAMNHSPTNHSSKTRKSGAHVDAWAIFFMIVVVAATAIYWLNRG